MAIIYDYCFETDAIVGSGTQLNCHRTTDTGNWNSEDDDDNDLNFSTDATAQALASTGGAIACTIDDSVEMYLTRTLAAANTSGIWRARFYIDPNSITWPNGQKTEVLVLQGDGSIWGEVMVVKFGKTAGGSYCIESLTGLEAGGFNSSGDITITDEPHYIECEIKCGTNASSDDGEHRLWVRTPGQALGTADYTDTAVDNYYRCYEGVQYCMFGMFQGSDTVPYSAPGGTVYLDELLVNDTGDAIGPLSAGGSPLSIVVTETVSSVVIVS